MRKTILQVLWSRVNADDELEKANAPTRDEVIRACVSMQPSDAIRANGEAQMRMVSTPIITAIRLTPDAKPLLLQKEKTTRPGEQGRVGAGVGRVSMGNQRSYEKPDDDPLTLDIGLGEVAVTREYMEGKKKDTSYSEEEQFGRLLDYFIERGEAFYLVNDSGCSGGWPWQDQKLIDRLHIQRAVRYHRVWTKLVLESKREFYVAQRAGAEEYLREHLEKGVSGVDALPSGWAEKYLGNTDIVKRVKTLYPKYRPGISVVVRRLQRTRVIAASDLSRLFRSFDLQKEFADLLEAAYTVNNKPITLVGTIEPLDYLSTDDNSEEKRFGRELQAYVLGKMAEGVLYQVLIGSIRGQLAKLESGRPITCHATWLGTEAALVERNRKRKEKGEPEEVIAFDRSRMKNGYFIHPVFEEMLLAAVELWEGGTGARVIEKELIARGYEGVTTSSTIHRWMTSDTLVGDQSVYGMVWPDVLPPVLVDAAGNPDRLRFRRMADRAAENGTTRPNPSKYVAEDPTKDRGHLGTGIAYDVCGYSIQRQSASTQYYTTTKGDVKKYTGSSTYRCECPLGKHKLFPYHVTLNEKNYHVFIRMVAFGNIEELIAYLSKNRERDALADQVARAREELGTIRAEVNEKRGSPEIHAQAVARAQRAAEDLGGDVDADLIEKAKKNLLKDLLNRERDATEALSITETRLRMYALPAEWEKLKAELHAVDEAGKSGGTLPSEGKLNEIAKKLMRIDFRLDDNDELKCDLTWVSDPRSNREVPLSVSIATNGRRTVRLPEERSELLF